MGIITLNVVAKIENMLPNGTEDYYYIILPLKKCIQIAYLDIK